MSLEPVTRYESDGGARIYRIPVRVFQMLVANVYIVIAGDYVALVDTGSGLGESDDHIRSGIEQIRDEWGEPLGWGDIKRVVVTHAHVDHVTGVATAKRATGAPVYLHRDDLFLSERAVETGEMFGLRV